MSEDLQEVTMIQGEGKWIRMTFTRSGLPLNMSGANKFFGVKRSMRDTAYAYQVNDGDSTKWDVTNAATGIIRVNVPASFTKSVPLGKYDCQARFVLTADTDVDKTQKFMLKIVPGVIPN